MQWPQRPNMNAIVRDLGTSVRFPAKMENISVTISRFFSKLYPVKFFKGWQVCRDSTAFFSRYVPLKIFSSLRGLPGLKVSYVCDGAHTTQVSYLCDGAHTTQVSYLCDGAHTTQVSYLCDGAHTTQVSYLCDGAHTTQVASLTIIIVASHFFKHRVFRNVSFHLHKESKRKKIQPLSIHKNSTLQNSSTILKILHIDVMQLCVKRCSMYWIKLSLLLFMTYWDNLAIETD